MAIGFSSIHPIHICVILEVEGCAELHIYRDIYQTKVDILKMLFNSSSKNKRFFRLENKIPSEQIIFCVLLTAFGGARVQSFKAQKMPFKLG